MLEKEVWEPSCPHITGLQAHAFCMVLEGYLPPEAKSLEDTYRHKTIRKHRGTIYHNYLGALSGWKTLLHSDTIVSPSLPHSGKRLLHKKTFNTKDRTKNTKKKQGVRRSIHEIMKSQQKGFSFYYSVAHTRPTPVVETTVKSAKFL